MECLLKFPINTETGNQKYSLNTLCSITFRAICLGGGGGQMGWEGGENTITLESEEKQ